MRVAKRHQEMSVEQKIGKMHLDFGWHFPRYKRRGDNLSCKMLLNPYLVEARGRTTTPPVLYATFYMQL